MTPRRVVPDSYPDDNGGHCLIIVEDVQERKSAGYVSRRKLHVGDVLLSIAPGVLIGVLKDRSILCRDSRAQVACQVNLSDLPCPAVRDVGGSRLGDKRCQIAAFLCR